jgi:predicted nucleotide-binding protein
VSLTYLTVPADDAHKLLKDRVSLGVEIDNKYLNLGHLDAGSFQFKKWDDYNYELLKRLFTDMDLAREYERATGFAPNVPNRPAYAITKARNRLKARIESLESILGRLELIPSIPDPGAMESADSTPPLSVDSKQVFVVHGHDGQARQAVARFLERMGLEPVILHEQASGGMTLIEKLEHHGSVPYAVILLTPDDEGRQHGTDHLRPRARQNVVLELGYFCGRLGRHRVCALYVKPVELPTDWDGVVWIPFDPIEETWKLLLARELRSAGYAVDMNNV